MLIHFDARELQIPSHCVLLCEMKLGIVSLLYTLADELTMNGRKCLYECETGTV